MKNPYKWVKIEEYSNWVEWDCYGKPVEQGNRVLNRVQDGDRVYVKWPSGTIKSYILHVEERSFEISDMGSPYTVHTSKAYIEDIMDGLTIKVYLNNKKLRVSKVEHD